MGSLRARGNFEGRVQRRKKRRFRPWGLVWRSSTTRERRIESGSEIGKVHPDRELILDCFQQGLAEVANTEHVEGTTREGGQQSNQAISPEVTLPKTSGTSTQDRVGV